MGLFKKLFGQGKNPGNPPPLPQPPANSAGAPAPNGASIRAFDKFGREIFIARKDWRDQVLPGQLKEQWNRPDDLAAVLIQALGDGFFPEIEKAAIQLQRIDPNAARGATLLAILYLQTERPADAERLLSGFLKQHGDDGVVLTNLAKAQSALGREVEAEQTLWHALEVDPNQDKGLGWYEVLHREKSGPAAGKAALARVAGIPGSWRARLWLARAALEARDPDAAIALYRESLAMAGKPVPTDLLMQMSGDLGVHGHIPEILQLAGPHFDMDAHGIAVGNNLIKASIDTGNLDSAHHLLRELQTRQRPDWKDTLGFWEAELLKAKLQTQEPVAADRLQMSFLTLDGPLWLKPDHPTSEIVPARKPGAPHIAFLGSSFEAVVAPSEIRAQPSNGPGRMSRALPLFLNETVHLASDARTTTLVPWIANGGGGFGVFSNAPDLAAMAAHARQAAVGQDGKNPADFLVATHLVTRGENWNLQLNLVRTIDAKTLFSCSHAFAEGDFRGIVRQLKEELLSALAREAEIESRTPPDAVRLQFSELDHYVFRLEQALAVRCCLVEGTSPAFLSNPAEILDGMLHLSLQNPAHLPSRLLLWRVLDGLHRLEPALVKSMAGKVRALQQEHPLAAPFQQSLDAGFESLFAAPPPPGD